MHRASSSLSGSEPGHGDQQSKEIPRVEVTGRERAILGFTLLCMAVAALAGAVYYCREYKNSQQNPADTFSYRTLVDEDFPVETMTVIPLLSVRTAGQCTAAYDFHVYFGFRTEGGWMYCGSHARWTLVRSLWVASLELPFHWNFNATGGQFVRFKDEYNSAKGRKKCRMGDTGSEEVACPEVAELPEYGAFNASGLQCDTPYSAPHIIPQVNHSGLYVQLHSEARNVTSELLADDTRIGDDPASFLVRRFKVGVFYMFDRDKGPDAYYNYLFKIKLHEHVFVNGTKKQALKSDIIKLPMTGGSYWRRGRTYFTVAADETVFVTKELLRMTLIDAVTAYATSATTVFGLFGLLFTTTVAVPLHFTFGRSSARYRKHIVRGVEGYGSDSSTEV